MKKVLILSSMLFIFLSACRSVEISIPATLTSTLPPPATATAQPPATVTEAPTEAPTATATAKSIDWAKATDEERHAAAPDTIVNVDGVTLTESNTSSIYNDLIIYRDGEGNAVKAFNGKEYKDLQNAVKNGIGVMEFTFDDGTKWEQPLFTPIIKEGATDEEIDASQIKALENAVNYMISKGVDWGNLGPFTSDNITQAHKNFNRIIVKIHAKTTGILDVPLSNNVPKAERFHIVIGDPKELQGNAASIVFQTPGSRDSLIVSMNAEKVTKYFEDNIIAIPANPLQ